MDAIVAHGEAAIAKGSTSFSLASRLFGKALREDVWRLYAWCRHCDDVIDGQDHGGASEPLSAAQRRRRLDALRVQTTEALAGAPVHDPAFQGFQRVALRHALPASVALELLDGFEADVEWRGYDSDAAMLRYCWGVAGTVGVLMAMIMGVTDKAVLRRAQDLGLAFQITNICRDVREDAANGRVYLPANRLEAAGIAASPAGVLDAVGRPRLHLVVTDMLDLADAYYRSARQGLRDLPFRGAVAVAVAREVYRAIGKRLLRAGPEGTLFRTRSPRASLPWRVGRGIGVALWSRLERLAPAPERGPLWTWL